MTYGIYSGDSSSQQKINAGAKLQYTDIKAGEAV